MKKNNIYLLIITASLLSACALIRDYQEHYKVVEFEYDHKTILVKAPSGYCFYNEKIPLDNDVVRILKAVNSNQTFDLELVMQNCIEKRKFTNNENPHFRDSLMIIFPKKNILKDLKKYNLERNRNIYVKFIYDLYSSEALKAVNKRIKNELLPKLRKEINKSIVDDSKNLTPEQKKELKLVHNQVFGNSSHVFSIYDYKIDQKISSYNYQEFSIGNLTTRCIAADTLINYVPITFAICRDKKSDSWDDMEMDIKKYVKDMINLNNDNM